jgi:hypothetical protein
VLAKKDGPVAPYLQGAVPVGTPWMTLALGHHEDRAPIYGHAETREAQ